MNKRQKTDMRNSIIQTLVSRDMQRCMNVNDAFEHVLEYGFKGYRNMTLTELDEEIQRRVK